MPQNTCVKMIILKTVDDLFDFCSTFKDGGRKA